jgi:hypothetical protein
LNRENASFWVEIDRCENDREKVMEKVYVNDEAKKKLK